MPPNDTPIETRYPWLKIGDVRPELPENPTERDFAKAYATMVIVYQAQRDQLVELLGAHSRERQETLAMLRTIERHQTEKVPMPRYLRIHSVALAVQFVAIVWLAISMINEQNVVERLATFH